MKFDWDEHNLFNIAQHGITREDVETALHGKTLFIKDEVRNGEQRRTVLGMAGDKRILVVITTPRAGKTRCVTAYRANSFFKTLYALKWPGA